MLLLLRRCRKMFMHACKHSCMLLLPNALHTYGCCFVASLGPPCLFVSPLGELRLPYVRWRAVLPLLLLNYIHMQRTPVRFLFSHALPDLCGSAVAVALRIAVLYTYGNCLYSLRIARPWVTCGPRKIEGRKTKMLLLPQRHRLPSRRPSETRCFIDIRGTCGLTPGKPQEEKDTKPTPLPRFFFAARWSGKECGVCTYIIAAALFSLFALVGALSCPQDAGFAPAVAFQTVAAEGVSGLLCAQLQALVQTALRPLARYAYSRPHRPAETNE